MALTAEERKARKAASTKRWYENNKEAAAKRSADWYRSNKERASSTQKARTDANRNLVAELKNVPCADCGGVFPPCVMDFDHVSENKTRGVAQMMSHSLDLILEEISKCEIVCANCHRIRTHERRTNSETRSSSFECSPV